MGKRQQRAMAIFFVTIFTISTVAVAAIVVIEMIQGNNNPAQEAQVDDNRPKLKGTKLANFTPVAQVNELQKIDTAPGNGKTVQPGDEVTVIYTGALASDGTIFDSSEDTGQPATLPLSGVIAGWSQGVPGMKEGGSRRLLIPAALAYGPQSQPGIPPNSNLVFDVTVLKTGK